MVSRQCLKGLLALLAGIAFIWLVVLKFIARLAARRGRSSPCPASVSWLADNPIRRRAMQLILDRVGIQPGDCVLELGPGPGAFTLAAARMVGPTGRLIAVDLQPAMIAQVERRVRRAGLANVETRVASAYQLPLPDASVDRAFAVTVLPEIPDSSRALAELRRVLKPGGALSITEEFWDPHYPFAAETIRRAEAQGFRLTSRHGTLWRYTCNFQKPAAPPRFRMADLPPLSRTLLIPLAYRAAETRRPDALLRDPRALELTQQFDQDFIAASPRERMTQVSVVLRTRHFDDQARDFLRRQPGGLVVDIGCGLDTRLDRLDDGQLVWFGLDVPEVIALRRRLLPDSPRSRLIAGSVLDPGWLDAIASEARPAIFLAEGVLCYFDEADARRVVLALRDRLPGCELVFDAMQLNTIRMHNLSHASLRRTGARLRWGFGDNHILETWAPGIRLVDEWCYTDPREPRLGWYNLLEYFPAARRASRILHYRLGRE